MPIMARATKQTVNSYDDIITFGKYAGKTIGQIADENPGYIVWLSELELVNFPDDILDDASSDYYEELALYAYMEEPF